MSKKKTKKTVTDKRKPIPKGVKPKIWSMKTADDEFSLFIRERDGWKCVRCGRQFEVGERGLTDSHFWGRAHKGTRYDPLNNDAICWFPCHAFHWEKEKQGEYRDFKLKQLGEVEYAAMERRARNTYPLSDAIIGCMLLLGKL